MKTLIYYVCDFMIRLKYFFVLIFVKFFQINSNFGFVFKQVSIFVNFVQFGPFLLIPFKSLTAMTVTTMCHFVVFLIFLIFIFLNFFKFFLNVYMSTQQCATCYFMVFFSFFFKNFLNVHVSIQQRATCQSQCSIFNLVPIFVIFVQFSSNFC